MRNNVTKSKNEDTVQGRLKKIKKAKEVSRNWCFTIHERNVDHKWEPKECDDLLEWHPSEVNEEKKIKYLVAQLEVCPDTKGIHWQGYVEFATPFRRNAAKETLKCKHAHLEDREGTREEARTYCMKEWDRKNPLIKARWGDCEPIEIGDFEKGGKGKRTDIRRVKEMLNEGANMSEILDEATSFQSARFAELYLKYKEKGRMQKGTVYWLHGGTGEGKTVLAWKLAEMFAEKIKGRIWVNGQNGSKWWQGYDGHEIVILDEVRRDFAKFHDWLRILDILEYTVEHKGGSRQFKAQYIIITSCKHPRDMWHGRCDEDISQLLRRIDHIWEIKNGEIIPDLNCGPKSSEVPFADIKYEDIEKICTETERKRRELATAKAVNVDNISGARNTVTRSGVILSGEREKVSSALPRPICCSPVVTTLNKTKNNRNEHVQDNITLFPGDSVELTEQENRRNNSGRKLNNGRYNK